MKKLVRRGSCNHCGSCCGNCDKLVNNKCSVWRTPEQPEVCRKFPTHPRNIPQGIECSIKFYDAETGQEITKKKRRNFEGNWECDWDELNSYGDLDEEC